jgi:hypothetical protein
MSTLFSHVQTWMAWYRVLRYRNCFNFRDSVRFASWLAHG